MTEYKFSLTDLRAGVSESGKRYARVRAIANGPDSYNSIFTEKARSSIIDQIKNNGVGSKVLHADDVYSNVSRYLEMRASNAIGDEKDIINTLKAQLPLTRYPIGKVVDAQFVDDNTIECIIEENTSISKLGESESNYLNASWDMIKDGTVKGVSVAFNTVKSFVQDGKTFIDGLILTGLDFVDKQAHPDTQTLEVFVRAAQESLSDNKGKKMTEEENKPKEENKPVADKPQGEKPKESFTDVEDIVSKKVDEKLSEADAKRKAEEDETARVKEMEDKLKALESEREEAISIAQDAVEKMKEKDLEVARKSNPHFEAAQAETDDVMKAYEGMSLGEIMGKYIESKK